jgi:hypothetical protein
MSQLQRDGFYRPPLTEIESETIRSYPPHTQRLYRFPNGQGASVINGPGTYGGKQGLWELAVLSWPDVAEDLTGWKLDYSTPVTDDVIGWLTPAQVEETLDRIEALPASEVSA